MVPAPNLGEQTDPVSWADPVLGYSDHVVDALTAAAGGSQVEMLKNE